VACGHREHENGRRGIEWIQVHAEQAHQAEAPHHAEDPREHRQYHPLHAAERPILDEQDDHERGSEEDRHLREVHVRRLTDDRDPTEIDLDVRVALAVHDPAHRVVERDEVGGPLVLREVGDHRSGLAVGRDQRVDVDRHRRHGCLQARDVLGRARHRVHHRPHLHAVGPALHLLHLARGEAEDVVAHRVRHQFERVLDTLDLGQHRRLVDVARPRRHANHGEIAAAEELLQLVRGLDVGVLLRRPEVGIRVHLQAAEPRGEKGGDQHDARHHQDAMRDDPPGVGAEHSGRGAIHVGLLRWPASAARAAGLM
jgi:hypothetical protein